MKSSIRKVGHRSVYCEAKEADPLPVFVIEWLLNVCQALLCSSTDLLLVDLQTIAILHIEL